MERPFLFTDFRLKVSYDDVYLHSVEANHFVDSPEYDNQHDSVTDGKYKVRNSRQCFIAHFVYKCFS